MVLARVGRTPQQHFGDEHTYRCGSDEFLVITLFLGSSMSAESSTML